MECSYGKIFSPVAEISVGKTEISATEPSHPFIWTLRNFNKGFSGVPRSRKSGQPGQPGSYEGALSPGRINGSLFSARRITLAFYIYLLKFLCTSYVTGLQNRDFTFQSVNTALALANRLRRRSNTRASWFPVWVFSQCCVTASVL